MRSSSPYLTLPLTLLTLALGACDLGGKHCIGDCSQSTDSGGVETTGAATDSASSTDASASHSTTDPTTTAGPPVDDQLGTCDLVPTGLESTCNDGEFGPGDICFSDSAFGVSIHAGFRSSVRLPPRAVGTPDLLLSHDDGMLSTVVLRTQPFNPVMDTHVLFGVDPLVLVAAADFDADGAAEVIAHAPAPDGRVYLILLSPQNDIIEALELEPLAGALTVDLADWNGDGNLDIVTVGEATDDGAPIRVLAGDGEGHLANIDGPVLPFASPEHALGALDGDGRADDFVLHAGMVIFRHEGGAVQEQSIDFPPNFDVRDVAVADLDHDDLGDIVAVVDNTEFNTSEVVVALSAAGFAYTRHSVACGAKVLEVVDFDQDGHLDLVVGSDAGAISVRRNDGAGGFSQLALGTMIFSPERLHVGDLDGDGGSDVLALHDDELAVTLTSF